MEGTHQILKSIVAQAINEVPELQRFVNLKSEIIAHAAVTLDRWGGRGGGARVGFPDGQVGGGELWIKLGVFA